LNPVRYDESNLFLSAAPQIRRLTVGMSSPRPSGAVSIAPAPVVVAPPPVAYVPPCPGRGYVWINGAWAFRGAPVVVRPDHFRAPAYRGASDFRHR